MGGWFAPEVRTFSRGKGDAPATAKAAYRAGICITDDRTGVVYDYSYRRDIEHSALFPPTPDSPDWTRDRAALWNSGEMKENRKNSVTARELMTPLPADVSKDARRMIAVEIAEFLRDRYGVAVDMNIHAPHAYGDDRNHHAHFLFTTRRIDANGWGEKTRELDESVKKDANGQSRGGAEIEAIRQECAAIINRHLEREGSPDRVDPRSYERRGIDREAQPHLGPAASNMERNGEASRLGDEKRAVEARNAERDALKQEAAIIDLQLERERRQAQADARNQARRDFANAARAAAGTSKIQEREKDRFESWANGKRAELQNIRLEAEGEHGRAQERERLGLENQLATSYGTVKKQYAASLETMQKRAQERTGIPALLYRFSGKARRDADLAKMYRATLADIARRETEQRQALAGRQRTATAKLTARHGQQAARLEKGIETARQRREAEGWKPRQREATTGQEIEPTPGIAREAENSPMEGREIRTGETTPGNEQAPAAQPEAARDGNSGAGQESTQNPPPGWSSQAEMEEAIQKAKEQREADEREQESRDPDDPGHEME
jgi:hypothetical protein